MSCWERVIVGTFLSVVGCCCALTQMVRGREPATVDAEYMEDRIRRQRQNMANVWQRDGDVRSQGGVSSIGHRSASSHADY